MVESGVTGPVELPSQHERLAAWLGRRVVVRHVLADGRATDVLGTLLAADGSELTVRGDSDGREAVVPYRDVVAAKPVPPRPARRRG